MSEPGGARPGKAPPVLVLWWVLFVITWFAGRNLPEDEVIDDLSDVQQFQSSDRTAAFGALMIIATAVAAIVMVRTLTARQHRVLTERSLLPG